MENNDAKVKLGHHRISKWFAFVRPTALLLIMVFLFTYVSFAWMRREWTPYVYQEGIKIATSGSLVFELQDAPDGTTSTGMNINEILKMEDFVLKPVSNMNGASDGFFNLNMTSGAGNETYNYLDVKDYGNDYMEMGKENGYIEFKLMLYSPSTDGTRYVYIHPDSKIKISDNTAEEKKSAINCVRVSVTLADQRTFIFVPDGVDPSEHMGVNDYPLQNGFLMDGVALSTTQVTPPGESEPVDVVKAPDSPGVVVGHFSDYIGGTYTDGLLTAPDTSKALFPLISDGESGTVEHWITIRVWAEGSHEDCTDEIAADAEIDLMLRFSSFTVNESAN